MISRLRDKGTAPMASWRNHHQELESAYDKLSFCLDNIQDLLRDVADETDPKKQVCLAVFDEDLTALVEECEEYLLFASPHIDTTYSSFLCRTDTVIEELKEFLFPPRSH